MAINYKLNGQEYSMSSNGTLPPGAEVISSTPGQYIGGKPLEAGTQVNITPQGYQVNGKTYSIDNAAQALPASALNTTKVPLPAQPVPENQNSTIGSAMNSTTSPYFGIGIGKDGLYEVGDGSGAGQMDSFQSLFEKYLANQPTPPSAEAIYNALPEKRAYEEAAKEVQNYTGQINAIVAKSQADQLSLIGQGRGVPEAIIGGQQAQISKEAAIKALPLQALLANAQGNKELAMQHLETTFKLKMTDATNQYEYKSKLLDSVYDFATKAQQRKLDALEKQNDRNFKLVTDATSFAQTLSLEAMRNGQSGLAAKLAQLQQPDPSSKTFKADYDAYNKSIGKLQGQLRYASAAPKAPEVKTINGVDAQWNPATQKWEPITLNGSTANVQQLAQGAANIQTINGVLNNGGLKTSVGTNFLSRGAGGFWGTVGRAASIIGLPTAVAGTYKNMTGERQEFIAGVEQLRSQLTLDSLVNAKARGATFGALSEGELGLLTQSASKLGTWAKKDKNGNVVGYNTSETNFKKEIDKINNLAKLDYTLKGGNPTDVGVVVQPDGTYWTKDSFGNLVQIR